MSAPSGCQDPPLVLFSLFGLPCCVCPRRLPRATAQLWCAVAVSHHISRKHTHPPTHPQVAKIHGSPCHVVYTGALRRAVLRWADQRGGAAGWEGRGSESQRVLVKERTPPCESGPAGLSSSWPQLCPVCSPSPAALPCRLPPHPAGALCVPCWRRWTVPSSGQQGDLQVRRCRQGGLPAWLRLRLTELLLASLPAGGGGQQGRAQVYRCCQGRLPARLHSMTGAAGALPHC